MMYWLTSSMPECLCRLSPHLGYRLVAELRLQCRCTAFMVVEMSVKRHDVLVDIFDARMFVSAFSAPRLLPRGGATIALPFHGIHGVLW